MADLRAGAAAADITPPLSIPFLGYVPRQGRFEGVHDRLRARALALDDGTRQLVLVTADAIGFADGILGPERSFRAAFHEAVAAAAGLAPDQVMLAASHAHSTPETLDITALYEVPGAVDWADGLCRTLAATVAEALESLQPARLKTAEGRAEGIATNRRQLLADGSFWQPSHGSPPAPVLRPGQVDETVPVVLAELEDGTCVVLANFTCHPVSVQVNPLVSADYPGVACALVEAAIPEVSHCLFTQGADGDINPRGGGSRQDFGDVARYGRILGGEIIEQAEQLRAPEVKAMEPVIGAAAAPLELPVRELPEAAPLAQECEAARGALEAAGTEAERFVAANRVRAAEERQRTLAKGPGPIRTEVQALRLGDVALVGLPGENFCETGLGIKRRSPAPHTLVAGLSGDAIGYLPTRESFDQGGYETTVGSTHYEPGAAERLVDAAAEQLDRLFDT